MEYAIVFISVVSLMEMAISYKIIYFFKVICNVPILKID
jgi:hypothetical protein